MKRFLIITFGLILVLYSCNKYGDGYIKGRVIDLSTGNPADGLNVYLLVKRSEGRGKSSETYIYGAVATGSDGTYKMDFFKKRPAWANIYTIGIGESAKYIGAYNGSKQIYKKTTIADFEVYQIAYAKVKITKTTTKQTKIDIKFNGQIVYRSYLLQKDSFTDYLLPNIFKVPGNYINKPTISVSYVDDGVSKDYFFAEQYIQIGDTALFSLVYD